MHLILLLAICQVPDIPDNPFGQQEAGEFIEVKEKPQRGWIRKYPPGDHAVIIHLDKPDPVSPWVLYLGDNSHFDLYVEDQKLTDYKVPDLYDRRVEVEPPTWEPGEANTGVVHRGKLILRKGIHPTVFREAFATEVPRDQIDKHHLAIVEKGMSSRLYYTRKAATNVLIRKGLAAVPALKYGLDSADYETRMRCEGALNAIRIGIEDPLD